MDIKENIIAIRSRNIREADKAFDEFMAKTECCFNERSLVEPKLYKNCTPAELEKVTEQLLKDVCPSTPFRPEDIKLVSGNKFPDIMATDYYGVEVKSTNKNKWTSTGSSIVETTRSELVERIYMLFGNLGSEPPKFRCKPYQDCLSGIAVTHAPRYLIDMCLHEEETILSKMETSYDDFRTLDEKSKISKVRSYYLRKARQENKIEMPWWMGEDGDADRTSCINLSIFSDQSKTVKLDLTMRAFILFSSIFDKDTSVRYKQIALWLCNRYSLICHNMRDSFTAGGVAIIGNLRCPKIVGNLIKHSKTIKKLLDHPDIDIVEDIRDYWDFDYDEQDYYSSWLNMVERAFNHNPDLKHINIRKLIAQQETLI